MEPDLETTPLLASTQSQHDLVYQRFSDSRKQSIVWMVSLCGLIPLFVTGTFTPSIPQIVIDLESTPSIVNLAVSLSAFAASVGGLVGGSYSTFYGRRCIYTSSLPLLVLGSIGVATAPAVPSLLFWRFFQALGAAPGLVLGAGVIGDIYRLEERGRAMGVFFAACLLGPALAPLAGGASSHYLSWRATQWILALIGLSAYLLMFLHFPETMHPGTSEYEKLAEDDPKRKRRLVWVNPLRPLGLLRSPNLFCISLITSASLMTVFVLLVPLAYTVGERYSIQNQTLVGACFLPAGVGNILGARLVGPLSDRTVIYWRAKRRAQFSSLNKMEGDWYPEDRLRASLLSYALTVPIPLIAFGLVNQYVDDRAWGIGLSLLCLFVNGVGVEMAFGPCAAYLVDVMHARSAESLAANGGLRSVLMAASIAVVLPLINTFGIALTNFFAAVLVWFAFGLLVLVIRYGNAMRAYVDVGFSTADNN